MCIPHLLIASAPVPDPRVRVSGSSEPPEPPQPMGLHILTWLRECQLITFTVCWRKRLCYLWFEGSSGVPNHIGRHAELVDQRLRSIKPPYEITRTPRSIHFHKHWKGTYVYTHAHNIGDLWIDCYVFVL